MLFFDFEVYKYDWLIVAIDPIQKKEFVVVNNKRELEKLYNEYRNDIWVGYNCRDYDQYILKAILLNFNPKEVNDWIIVKDRKGWEFSSLFRRIPINLFDVMPNPPVSLKTLEGFMGKSIHETSVPFDVDRKLTAKELGETIEYCRFDVLNTIDGTADLVDFVNDQIALLDKKAAKAKETAAAKKVADPLMDIVFNGVTDELSTVADIVARIGDAELTAAKASYRLNKLAEMGNIVKDTIKVDKRTLVAYKLA